MLLRRPRFDDEATILEMITEFEAHNSQHDGGFWNPREFSYNDWLQQNREYEMGINIPSHFVPSIQLVSFDANNRALGFLNLRLRLNDVLLQKGGHIGYSIRPIDRGKGYAKEQLRQGLQLAKEKNIKSVLLTCHKDNLASRKTILACGGRYEDTRDSIERYWIDLEG
ncbi:GNAT family N-acetyltransferase [Streptococcus zalophi]|uniref:GNAT family N-acetyltransferase n=1 Tax=Streptococcus zalophi TaxID=640031 RepID=UPI00215C7D15|nr:GNAT family N-acetyltransferase [Streptococcus zalophi]MCR8968094.1 GNAT family N-acetyltransferase [Streptococcus zalophi]